MLHGPHRTLVFETLARRGHGLARLVGAGTVAAASEEPAARWTAIDDDESQRPSGADEIEEAVPSKASDDAPSEQDAAQDRVAAGPQSIDDKTSETSPGLSEAADNDYSATEIIKSAMPMARCRSSAR